MSTDAPLDPDWPRSDEDMYLAVTTAWCRMFSRTERRKHPLRPYVLGRDFARSVAGVPVDGLYVATVCARLACRRMQGRGVSWPLEHSPQEALDPAAAWWYGMEEPEGFGVHHAELGGGTLEFLLVAHRNERPNLEGCRERY